MKNINNVSDLFIDLFTYLIIAITLVVTLFPLIYVISASISSPEFILKNQVVFLPKGFSLMSYYIIFRDSSFWLSYYNTVWYTAIGTTTSILFTMIAAYPLSRNYFFARKFFMFVFVFTMFFSGGLIPSYLLIVKLGLYNSRWALIIPGLISTWNLIITRTYIQTTIQDGLLESARIEGASEFTILRRVVFPLCKPIMATLAVFIAVGHWNSWFAALLYLSDTKLQPLQLLLRRMLLLASTIMLKEGMASFNVADNEMNKFILQIKYSAILISILPILMVYPFAQKYFVKGVMIGSLKG